MWQLIRQLIYDLALLFVVVWLFAGTFEPLRLAVFGNWLIKQRAILVMRILTAITLLLLVVIIVVDVMDMVGFLSKGGGS